MTPFSGLPESSLASLGETVLLAHIRTWLDSVAPQSPYGMGDDTAVIAQPTANLITTDSLVYGRHFDDEVSAELAGAKLLKRNLSDIAAMGGRPCEAVMAAFLPPHTNLAWLEAFTRGLATCAREYAVHVVGGDLTQTDAFLGFNLTLLGHAPNPLLRSGAAVGDTVWVTGALGGSRRARHATFTPRLDAGQWLAARPKGQIHALIDVTDGLAKDLPAILPQRSAAAIELEHVPVSADAHANATVSGRSVLDHAFTDGEDYELLFALAGGVCPQRFASEWRAHSTLPFTCIGKIVESTGAASLLNAQSGEALSFGTGYEHFGKA